MNLHNVPSENDGYVKVADRLKLMWGGVGSTLNRAKELLALDVVVDEEMRDQFESWSDGRTALAESVWGIGFINPGSTEFLRNCLSPVKIKKNKNILDLTAGLGGTAIMLARNSGAWIDAFEPNPTLAGKAQLVIAQSPVGNQIDIQPVEFGNFVIPQLRYHIIYSLQRLYATQHKQELLQQVAKGLKANGQLLLMDYVVSTRHGADPAVQEWMVAELGDICPWSQGRYLSVLDDLGFQVQPIEDFSSRMAEEINSAWCRMLHRLEAGYIDIDRNLINHIVAEGNIWQKRVAAMHSGCLKLVRINATKRYKKI